MSRGGPLWAGSEPLILASRSEARRALLISCGIAAEPVPADVDERKFEAEEVDHGALPVVVARRLAAEKARAVSLRMPRRVVLGADQVLAFEDRCWAKAANRAEAATRLSQLASRTHDLVSACAVACSGALLYESTDIVSLAMRPLSKADIETYLEIAGDQVLASVGAYRIEAVGRVLFERVDADHSAILGLPLPGLLRYFRSAGLLRL